MADKKDVKIEAEEEEADSPEKKPEKKKETDEMRSERRGNELSGHLDEHMERIKKINKDYPTPFGVRFQDMVPADQLRWNQKRAALDKANRDYHYAIKDAVGRHMNEEVV